MPDLFNLDEVTRAVLSRNIYGVDINPEAIEIARLAIWLHTALPGRPLSSLDRNIRCGNSLVGPDIYDQEQGALFSPEARERINVFDWRAAFPEVFGRPGDRAGFDVVVGNPPYVKLQHFRRVQPDVAEYLSNARRAAGTVLYESTRGRSYDLYIPFIERGVELLNAGGRLGFIAPSVWLVSEYGEALRAQVLGTRRLERWLDFRDFPVFEEAMTYTALQFFRGAAVDSIKCVVARDGELGAVDWTEPDATIEYSKLSSEDPWLVLTEREHDLIERLSVSCSTLGNYEGVLVGVRGVETGADHYFHFKRIGPGKWRHAKGNAPRDENGELPEVELEEELMKPLVSGSEARRYVSPSTETFVLYPYHVTGPPKLRSQEELENRFPRAWAYFEKHERSLRDRENGRMDRDDGWWGYNYPKNMDKHHLPKLGVAQTVPEMRVFYDEHGTHYFNNVRVGGIIPAGAVAQGRIPESEAGRPRSLQGAGMVSDARVAEGVSAVQADEAWFLMGVLNSRVVDFVFRRISKPKEPRPSGAYFEANKQYLEPLPIPMVAVDDQGRVVALARALQAANTRRRDLVAGIEARIASPQMVEAPRPYEWLWAEIESVAVWKSRNPDGLTGRALTAWAREQRLEQVGARLAEIAKAMTFGAPMCATAIDGELRLYVGGQCVVSGVYVDERDAVLILAQWRQAARDKYVSDSLGARELIDMLLKLRDTTNDALIEQIRQLGEELSEVERVIVAREREMDDLAYDLYGLSEAERLLVEVDTRARWDARIPMPAVSCDPAPRG